MKGWPFQDDDFTTCDYTYILVLLPYDKFPVTPWNRSDGNNNPTPLNPCLPTNLTCWAQRTQVWTPGEQARSARSLHFSSLLSYSIPRLRLFYSSYLLLSEEQLSLHRQLPIVAVMIAANSLLLQHSWKCFPGKTVDFHPSFLSTCL